MAKILGVRDCGDGFYTETERVGAATWYYAMQLNAPRGNIVRRRIRKFSYARDALAQVDAWKAEDAQKDPTQ